MLPKLQGMADHLLAAFPRSKENIQKNGNLYCGFSLFVSYLTDETALKSPTLYLKGGRVKQGMLTSLVRLVWLLVICFVLGVYASWVQADQVSDEQLYDINIPALNAAEALNLLADQTGAILLFPFDVAKARQANAVAGRYTLIESLELLLRGSGLSGGLSDKRAILISIDETAEHTQKEGPEKVANVSFGKKFTAALAAVFFTSGTAGAQTGDADQPSMIIEEVIVTATRRDTGIQTTPVSISAFSGAFLEEMGKNSIAQFIDAVPGVTSAAEGPGVNRIIIRNIATSTQESGSPTIATYFDDFALTAILGGSPEIRLVDMERVEVLKGPQGTLFGRSAMGGIVRYISNKPSTDKLIGGFNTYLSNTTDGGTNYGGHGYLNIPLSETLAIRMVAYSYQNDGFLDNVELGAKDYNDEDTLGGRFALHWDATEALSLDITYLNQEIDAAPNWVTTTRDPGDLDVAGDEGPDIPFDVNGRTQVAGIVMEELNTQELLNLKLEYDLDAFTTTFLATRSKTDFNFVFDQREFIGVISGCVCDYLDPVPKGLGVESDIVELRMVSSGEHFIDWIAGLYYEDSEDNFAQTIRYLGPDQIALGFLPLTEGLVLIDSLGETSSKEKAAYAELGFNFSAATQLTLGYRRSDVEYGQLSTKADGVFLLFTGADQLVGIPFETQEDVNTYKVSLDHSFNENLFGYALASSGYRRGGFNQPTFFSPGSTFDSDDLWNYELGLKSTWLDGRLVANASAYLLKYSDIQLVVQDPVTFERYTQNVGKADVMGVELGVEYQVNNNLRLGIGGSLSDPELKEDVPGGASGKKGDRLPGSATESLYFTANWNRPLNGELDLFASAFYRYVGDRLNDFNTDLDVELPSYSLTDLRLGIDHRKGWSLALFADNVFDEAIIYVIDRQGPTFESVPTNRPRTVGLNFIYNYR